MSAPRPAGFARLARLVPAALLGLLALLALARPASAAEPVVPTGATTSTLAPAAPQPTLAPLPTATPITTPAVPTPAGPTAPEAPGAGNASLSVDLGDGSGSVNQSLAIIIGITLLSVAPSLILMCTSFTRIVIVLSMTRNAIGLQAIPPNQVVVGLAMFLSLFVMSPTLSKMNHDGLQPLLHGQASQGQAFEAGTEPLKTFMCNNTRTSELNMMIKLSNKAAPETCQKTPLTTMIPAFVLSELKTAFIIGFVIFIPFLIIDLVVSSVLMALGMMMLPPVFVSLPFKLLLFVMVDGWTLVAQTLVNSFHQ
jgi:flagellar biosynthetic protein FliP